MPDAAPTVADLVARATQRLTASGAASPRLDAELLMAVALGAWLSTVEIDSLLRRRDVMKTIIAALVTKHGNAAVFVRAQSPS